MVSGDLYCGSQLYHVFPISLLLFPFWSFIGLVFVHLEFMRKFKETNEALT
jgi:hypothetical protein